MADVTGPISSLPGAVHTVPTGTMCDCHPDVPAVRRVQGETDSFGSEMHDLCQACVDELKAHSHEARCGFCDWCKNEVNNLRPRRDFDEGLYGPVYYICGACAALDNERLRQEAQDDLTDYDDGDDGDFWNSDTDETESVEHDEPDGHTDDTPGRVSSGAWCWPDEWNGAQP